MIILSVSARAHACVCMCAFAGDKVLKGETTQGRVRCQKYLNMLSSGFIL